MPLKAISKAVINRLTMARPAKTPVTVAGKDLKKGTNSPAINAMKTWMMPLMNAATHLNSFGPVSLQEVIAVTGPATVILAPGKMRLSMSRFQ
ncbi:MAG: hypothetical protein PHO01_05505 [Desulfotomaculaceae bacterium]|nr:hypothetical protein [Desulfotomaculaceae bacterium]